MPDETLRPIRGGGTIASLGIAVHCGIDERKVAIATVDMEDLQSLVGFIFGRMVKNVLLSCYNGVRLIVIDSCKADCDWLIVKFMVIG